MATMKERMRATSDTPISPTSVADVRGSEALQSKVAAGSCHLHLIILLQWTLTADLQRRIRSTEMRCYRSLLGNTYTQHVTNDEVRQIITLAIGQHDDLLTLIKKQKL